MSISAEPFGSEEAPSPVRNPESSNDVEQVNKDTGVVAILERDEERRIQGVTITDYIRDLWMMMPPKKKRTTGWTRPKQ